MLGIGGFQEDVLLAIKALEDDSYGMNIRNFLEDKNNREIHMPQIYAALARLETLGLVDSHLDHKKSAGQRGRTRRVYTLNAHGLQLLSDAVRHSHGAGVKESCRHGEGTTAATA